jgi:hypothetical protein
MLFTDDALPALAAGSTTVTFRRWKRPQAKVGGRFRKRDLWFEVDAVDVVTAGSITDADAHRAGEADAGAVRARLGDPPDDAEVYRVAFHRVEPDGPPLAERAELGPDDVAELVERLDRLDRASPRGPWTRRPSAEFPAVRRLPTPGRAAARFRRGGNVRKLKALGLTTSLEVGYELSPRGQALRDATAD